MRTACIGLVAAVVLCGKPIKVVASNYVVNGGFETGATSGVLSPTYPGELIYVFGVGGQTAIGGWTVTSSGSSNGSTTPLSLLVTGNSPQTPASGDYAVDFDPFWSVQTGDLIISDTLTGTLPQISQVIQLPAGQYTLDFDAAIELADMIAPRSVLATLAGAASLSQTATTSLQDIAGYDHFSYDFSSSGGAVTLTFTPNDYTNLPNLMLDNVSITPTPETIPGDANHDGVVNGLDIALVASNWLQTGASQPGDVNGDGVVNGLDIALIASNWLHTASGGGNGASVPEPSTLALAALGGLVLLYIGRRRAR